LKVKNEKINEMKKEIAEKNTLETNLKDMFEKVLNENVELKNKVESFEFQDNLNNDMNLRENKQSSNYIINNQSNRSLTMGKNSENGSQRISGSNLEFIKRDSKNIKDDSPALDP